MVINVYLARLFTKGKKSDSEYEIIQQNQKDNKRCSRHFGYLANRPKDAPIPQECLVCSKIVNCMLKLKWRLIRGALLTFEDLNNNHLIVCFKSPILWFLFNIAMVESCVFLQILGEYVVVPRSIWVLFYLFPWWCKQLSSCFFSCVMFVLQRGFAGLKNLSIVSEHCSSR